MLMKKRVISILVVMAMVLTLSVTPSFAVSKKNAPKLSASKVSLDIGVKKTIKLKNAKSKVKWSSSNEKVAVVTKKRGKRGSIITIKTKKHGTCKIVAESGGKKYKCTVKVSKVVIKPLSSSSVEKSGKYKYKKKLGTSGGKQFRVAVSDFSFDLLGKLADKSNGSDRQNILISPASILTAMVITENGARGKTLTEMQNTLSGGIDSKTFNGNIAGLNSRLCGSKSMIYQQANSLWIRKKSVKVKKSFLKKNKEYHNAKVYYAPFNSKTVKDINTWVFNNSRNMIDRIINRLDTADRMVIVNTTAFEGKWAEPFRDPQKEKFTSADGSVSRVNMLAASGYHRYIKLNGGKGFAKYYIGDDKNHSIAFVGILPPEGTDVNDFAKGISGSDWINAWNSSKSENLVIKVPEFKYDYSASLGNPLAAMGMKTAFTPGADFSRMTSGPDRLQIDDVLHKTHIELDKNGTKAAAATAVVMKASSIMMDEPIEVYLNRPFVYALVDAKTGIPLFAGIIYRP